MREEKYHSFDIEKYHAMKYAGLTAEDVWRKLGELSRPCNTDPIEEELDPRLLLM
jgi:hypothetical protein